MILLSLRVGWHAVVGITVFLTSVGADRVWAQALVPGTGQLVPQSTDDFEDPAWSYSYHPPKASHEQDRQSERSGKRRDAGLSR